MQFHSLNCESVYLSAYLKFFFFSSVLLLGVLCQAVCGLQTLSSDPHAERAGNERSEAGAIYFTLSHVVFIDILKCHCHGNMSRPNLHSTRDFLAILQEKGQRGE